MARPGPPPPLPATPKIALPVASRSLARPLPPLYHTQTPSITPRHLPGPIGGGARARGPSRLPGGAPGAAAAGTQGFGNQVPAGIACRRGGVTRAATLKTTKSPAVTPASLLGDDPGAGTHVCHRGVTLACRQTSPNAQVPRRHDWGVTRAPPVT